MRFHPTALVSLAVAAVGTALLWPRLPERVPVHWGISGAADRFVGRGQAAIEGLAIAVATWLVLRALYAVLRRGSAEMRRACEGACGTALGLCVFLACAAHLAVLASAAGWRFDVARGIVLAAALMMIVTGNAMGRIRANPIAGVRTPYTFRDPEVWRRTNRLGGRLFVGIGLSWILIALVLPTVLLGPVIVAELIAGSLWLWRYSRREWERRELGR